MPTRECLMIRIKRNPLHVGESSSGPSTIGIRECNTENGHEVVRSKEEISESRKQNTVDVVPIPKPDLEKEVEESGELLDEVDTLCHREEESDTEDAPDWMFEEGELRSKDRDYV